MFERLNKKMNKLGFKLVADGSFGSIITYQRPNERYKIVQEIQIMLKANDRISIMSYQAGTNKDGFNNAWQITPEECELAIKIGKKLKKEAKKKKYKYIHIG